jgi:hypothetical protein
MLQAKQVGFMITSPSYAILESLYRNNIDGEVACTAFDIASLAANEDPDGEDEALVQIGEAVIAISEKGLDRDASFLYYQRAGKLGVSILFTKGAK